MTCFGTYTYTLLSTKFVPTSVQIKTQLFTVIRLPTTTIIAICVKRM